MDTLINIIVGIYVLFECLTALNEMNRVSFKQTFNELKNPYFLKYSLLGLYALLVLYHAHQIKGWYCLLAIPAIICVAGRTKFRFNHIAGIR